ncbi:hypothetical protein [Natronorubrum halalkaliphilum]|uniref:hypothetical protein n=1 Tax=Natronorubrum halalkaliphilum TaxID=2691917 RepID=UPI00191594EC|nr:hypothetical protein [Natronorubrum halalkaliphilum]
MAYSCTTSNEPFRSADGVTQHVALHHSTYAAYDEEFGDVDDLREDVHEKH